MHASSQQFFLADDRPELPYQRVDRARPFAAAQDGIAVYIDHIPSQRVAGTVVPIVQIFDEHMPVASAVFIDSETFSGLAWVAFAALDPDTCKPQVVMTRDQDGGVKCCLLTSIFSDAGTRWERIEAPYPYADVHYQLIDVDGDGCFELLGLEATPSRPEATGNRVQFSFAPTP